MYIQARPCSLLAPRGGGQRAGVREKGTRDNTNDDWMCVCVWGVGGELCYFAENSQLFS